MTIFLNWIYKNVLADRPTACKARSGWAPPEGIPSLNQKSEVITYSECLIQIVDTSFLEFGFIKITPMPIGSNFDDSNFPSPYTWRTCLQFIRKDKKLVQ
jgi:hypothetical protein